MKIEYEQIPPQVFVSRMNRLIEESQLTGLIVWLRWEQIKDEEPQSHSMDETQQQRSTASYMYIPSESVLKYMFAF